MHLEEVKQGKPKPARKILLPKGRYVYAWFIDGKRFPFYVGRGVEYRAWAIHTSGVDGKLAKCERIRRALGDRFLVRILRENLTDEGSRLIESAFIGYFTVIGVPLANISSGLNRLERPPLELG
jgi:hypothetical protein